MTRKNVYECVIALLPVEAPILLVRVCSVEGINADALSGDSNDVRQGRCRDRGRTLVT